MNTAKKRKTPPDVSATNEAVFAVISRLETACTASDVAETTGLNIRKVSASIHYLVSSGRVFHAGARSISKHREVNLYSAKSRDAVIPASLPTQQTWLSPLLS